MSTSLQRLSRVTEVTPDPRCETLIQSLLKYAEDQVAENLPTIRHVVESTELQDLDLFWPGLGFNNAACGGAFEVLALLQKQGLLQVHDIVGASCGAASALLCLADENASAETLLAAFMIYASWSSERRLPLLRQAWRTSRIWSQMYAQVIEEAPAFDRVRKRGHVAVGTGRIWRWENWILTGFTTRRQCAQAYRASGECSGLGAFVGVGIDGLEGTLGYASDYGGLHPIPDRDRPLIFHRVHYGYALTCTLETIELLFKKGVDDTIRMLCNEDLLAKELGEHGGCAVLDGPQLRRPRKDWQWGIRRNATFLNVETGEKTFGKF